MPYSAFTLRKIREDLGLQIVERDIFVPDDLPYVPFPPEMARRINDTQPLAVSVNTEKARSEFLIAPMLSEVWRVLRDRIALFSGIEMNVDSSRGLEGVCDFLVARSPVHLFLSAPVLVAVEAKNDNLKDALPQCIAAMFAARIFNEREGHPVSVLHGLITTGSAWKFLQLEGDTVTIDLHEHPIQNPDAIFSRLLHILRYA